MLATPDRQQSESSLTLISWNILLDRTHGHRVVPQEQRLAACAKTLMELELDLDVVAIQEAELTEDGQHNGERLAELVSGMPGYWQQHSRSREFIGMFGSKVDEVEFIDLGHKKTAAISYIDEIAITGAHLKHQLQGMERAEQMAKLLDHLKNQDQAVIMGDFNCLPRDLPRKMMEAEGFQSAYTLAGKRRPLTVPTAKYRTMNMYEWKPRLQKRSAIALAAAAGIRLPVDDIYIRGLAVEDAGSFVGDSDHAGVWTRVRPLAA